jgi:membrane-associated protein
MGKSHIIDVLNHLLFIFDAESLIRHGGLLIVLLIVYGTTGLFFCFFIPSSAVVFALGVFAAAGRLHYDIITICVLLILASILGNLTGYWVGWKTGPLLYKREDTRFFKKKHLTTAESFYIKYGWLALTVGLFLPIIRTFVSSVAGIVRLNFRRYLFLMVAGSVFWILSFVLAGYFIGSVPALKSSLNYIILGFVLVVTIPLIIWIIKELKRLSRANLEKKKE